jgi:hypothetical protein
MEGATVRYSESGKICSGDYMHIYCDPISECVPEGVPVALMKKSAQLIDINFGLLMAVTAPFVLAGLFFFGAYLARKINCKVFNREPKKVSIRIK